MKPPRPCITPGCNTLTRNSARCPNCARTLNTTKNQRRATLAPPGGAAHQLRQTINRTGSWPCAQCGKTHEAYNLEVDHTTPLADGGTDTPDNVQALCRPHHHNKTATEQRHRHRN